MKAIHRLSLAVALLAFMASAKPAAAEMGTSCSTYYQQCRFQGYSDNYCRMVMEFCMIESGS